MGWRPLHILLAYLISPKRVLNQAAFRVVQSSYRNVRAPILLWRTASLKQVIGQCARSFLGPSKRMRTLFTAYLQTAAVACLTYSGTLSGPSSLAARFYRLSLFNSQGPAPCVISAVCQLLPTFTGYESGLATSRDGSLSVSVSTDHGFMLSITGIHSTHRYEGDLCTPHGAP